MKASASNWPIMETLTAFVRERSPARKIVSNPFFQLQAPQDAEQKQKLTADIQAVLTVLGKRLEKDRTRDVSEGRRLVLADTNLRGAQLSEAHFDHANLSWVILSEANLKKATLVKAFLIKARLDGAYLGDADLQDARLSNARLSMACLDRAHLERAVLIQARLEGAELIGAYFKGADLTDADLTHANVKGTDLSKAKGLTQQQLDRACGDEKTRLPAALKRPAHWSSATPEEPDNLK